MIPITIDSATFESLAGTGHDSLHYHGMHAEGQFVMLTINDDHHVLITYAFYV